MLTKFLVFSLIIYLINTQCQANYQIDGLQTGSITFNMDSQIISSSQTYNHLFYHFFLTSPSIAIAIQDFAFKYSSPHYLAIYPNYISESGVTFQIDFSSSIVTKIRINFLAATHQQLRIGNFKINNLQFEKGAATVSTNIGRAFSANQAPTIRVFINGYDSTSSIIQLSVAAVNLQATQLAVKISIGRTSLIKYVLISYIAFSPKTSSFISYGGQITNNKLEGTMHQDVSNNIYKSSNLIFGMALIAINGNKQISFTSNINDNFIATVTSLRSIKFAIVYIAIGKSVTKACQYCYGLPIANGQYCVKACPTNTNSLSYQNGQIGCKTCPQDLGFYYQNKKCTQTPIIKQVNVAQNNQPIKNIITNSLTSTSTQTKAIEQVKCQKNAIFNGVDCVCEIGFIFMNGQCRSLNGVKTQTVQINVTPVVQEKPKQVVLPVINTPIREQKKQTQTIVLVACEPGMIKVNGQCVPRLSANCKENSYDNGLGVCVCNQGYYNQNGQCVFGTICPQNSIKNQNGNCVCLAGFTNYSGICSRCAPGTLWNQNTKNCSVVCGPNSIYSAASKSCVCINGFGLFNGNCVSCPQNYYAAEGYCVTCPVRSQYNKKSLKCQCQTGYFINEYGMCTFKCEQNQIYSQTNSKCECINGLGKVNGVCQICPLNSYPSDNGDCSICKQNEHLVDGVCRCKMGYAYNPLRICTICSDLKNGFTLNGACSTCPGNRIYDGKSSCICPSGYSSKNFNSLCVRQCQNNEFTDQNGQCYSCKLNQIFFNGKCVCRQGYAANQCGLCVLTCGSNYFHYQGNCATCPLNTIYNQNIRSCVCPSDHYKNNYGVCQKIVLQRLDCLIGQYSDQDKGCLSCPSNCDSCSNNLKCNICSNGYILNQLSLCITLQQQQRLQQIQQQRIQQQRNQQQQKQQQQQQQQISQQQQQIIIPLSQQGTISLNGNNIFLTLRTKPTFTFSNPTQMQSFLKSSFAATVRKPTVYCAQRNLDFSLFDCLLIYPSGVPNNKFSVTFSYDYQGKKGSAIVTIDPLQIGRTNSKYRN